MQLEDFVAYDFEIAPNRFFLGLLNAAGEYLIIHSTAPLTSDQKEEVRRFVEGTWLVGYNSNGFDSYLLHHVLERNARPIDIYELGQEIISGGADGKEKHWEVARRMNARRSGFREIDLLNYLMRGKLKVYEARLAMNRVETLPFDHASDVTDQMVPSITHYLKHDLLATWRLLESVFEEILIRRDLEELSGVSGLLLKPPATAAELVIVHAYCRADEEVEPEAVKAAARRFRDCVYTLTIEPWVKRVCAGTMGRSFSPAARKAIRRMYLSKCSRCGASAPSGEADHATAWSASSASV